MIEKVGLVGVGVMAQHYAALLHSEGVTVSAACGRSLESENWRAFEAAAPACRRVPGLLDLMADDSLDGIIACASWNEMPDIATTLVQWHKPVLLEKPVALNLADARALSENAGNNRIVVGYNRRFYEPVTRLRERLRDVMPRSVSCSLSETVFRQRERFGAEIVPHLLAFSSAHALDLLQYLLGPLSIGVIYAREDTGPSAPFISYNGVLESANGTPINFSLNGDDPSSSEIRLRFDDGAAWVLSPFETLTVYKGMSVHPPTVARPVRRYEPTIIRRIDADFTWKPGLLGQVRAFISGDDSATANLKDAVSVMALIEAIKMSDSN